MTPPRDEREATEAGLDTDLFVFPASFGQQRLWFMDEVAPGRATYNVPLALRLRGTVDPDALEAAAQSVVARHESLRTTFDVEHGEPVQVVHPVMPVVFECLDCRNEEQTSDAALARMRERARAPFDLRQGPLFRFLLLRSGADEHLFLTVVHHIVADGWSVGLLLRELETAYEAIQCGRLPVLPELPLQYADFALWQHEMLSGERLEALERYWRDQLAAPLPVLEVPTVGPRPASYLGGPAGRRGFRVPEALSAAVDQLARSERVTPFMVYLAVFQLLLARYGDSDDVVVGTPVAGRQGAGADVEPLIGLFINMLALRTDLSGEPTFRELLARVRETTLGGFAQEAMPFERVVAAVRPERDPSRTPIFQALFTMQNVPQGAGTADGKFADLQAERLGSGAAFTMFELGLTLAPHQGSYRATLEYDRDLYADDTVARFERHYLTLLAGATKAPELPVRALAIMADDERSTVLERFNATALEVPPGMTVDALIAARASADPTAVSLVVEGGALTRGELEGAAEAFATRLRAAGVGRGDFVAVYAERSLELVVALLAVLKAGAAIVPIDVDYPPDRARHMLEDSGASMVLTQADYQDRLPQTGAAVLLLDSILSDPEVESPDASVAAVPSLPDDPIYLLYTSGSTGRPKGVIVPHRAVVNHTHALQDRVPLSSVDVLLQRAPLSFDAAMYELFCPLVFGARLVLSRPGAHRDADQTVVEVVREGVTVLQTVPSLLRLLLEAPGVAECTSVRALLIGGEAMTPDLISHVRTVMPWARLYNCYGPTETTIDATIWEVPSGATPKVVPIGRPIANARAYVLDRAGQPTPIGVAGELYVAGAGVADGYWQRPELTASRFLNDPFVLRPGARMYRTGDRARWRDDGDLEYLGRLDEQVKLRGQRIELAEIESVLMALPHVAEAVVVLRSDPGEEPRLVGYVVPEVDKSPAVADLREGLKQFLPAIMIPARIVLLDQLPLTPIGKLDRRALPLPEASQVAGEFVAPTTPTEVAVAAAYAEALRIASVGARDDFYDLGGHSLLAIRIAARLGDLLGTIVPIRMILDYSTVAALAAAIDVECAPSVAPGLNRIETVSRPQSPGRPFLASASFAQARLWFLEEAAPGRSTYNVPTGLRLKGPLDVPALTTAINALAARHESLRTSFEVRDGELMQVVQLPAAVPVEQVDLSSATDPVGAIRTALREAANQPFDLRTGPLARFVLFKVAEDDHVLLMVLHHIITDGWSMGVLLSELAEAYSSIHAGRAPGLLPLRVQYADYAVWQRARLAGDSLEELDAYWLRQLAGPLPVMQLPSTKARPASLADRPAGRFAFRIPESLAQRMDALARGERATAFMISLAAFQLLLVRYTGQDDVIVGSPMSGRTASELEPLVGLFLNTLALRTDCSGDPTFRELLGRVREVAIGGFAHQALPFERVVDLVKPPRHPAMTPIFQIVFSMENSSEAVSPSAKDRAGGFDGLKVEPAGAGLELAKFDLQLTLVPAADGYRGSLVYDAGLLDGDSVERMASHFLNLLTAATGTPDCAISRLPIIDERERHLVVEEWNDTTTVYPRDASIVSLFADQVRRTPDATALRAGSEALSYAELARRSESLAAELLARGAGAGQAVGLSLERSTEMIVALLAILRAGAAYVPLDPVYPDDRLAGMLEDAEVGLVIVNAATAHRFAESTALGAPLAGRIVDLADALAARPIPAWPEPPATAPAYVLFTSGSSGRPKGVVVPHRAVVRLVRNTNYITFTPDDRVLGFAPLSFDASTFEIWGALLNGAELVLAPAAPPSISAIGVLLEEAGITTAWLTASLFREMVDTALPRMAGLHHLLAGGDVLSPPHVQRFLEAHPTVRLINGYGPTENTTFTCCHQITAVEPGRSIPIGRPIGNTRVYLLDAVGEPVPVGVPGELYAAGDGVAIGYAHQPTLNAERFLLDPFDPSGSGRLYRTGDFACWRADGTIEFLGRRDHQVKIRGYRIELGEIEAALARSPQVAEAVVTIREDAPGDPRLVAYVVLHAGCEISTGELMDGLRRSLPSMMLPSVILRLDHLPLTPAGKLDRMALPRPDGALRSVADAVLSPRNPLEEEVTGIWMEVLGLQQIGVTDDFFELGGNSLLAMRMMAAIERVWGHRLQFGPFFERPTIATLVKVLVVATTAAEAHGIPVLQKDGPGTPLAFVHGDVLGHGWYCRRLAPLLGEAPMIVLPTCGPETPGRPSSIEEMARHLLAALRSLRPNGPYRLGGYCHGALVAYEMARLLAAEGEEVTEILMVDGFAMNLNFTRVERLFRLLTGEPANEEAVTRLARLHYLVHYYKRRPRQVSRFSATELMEWGAGLVRRRLGLRARAGSSDTTHSSTVAGRGPGLGLVGAFVQRAQRAYVPGKYAGTVNLFWASEVGRGRWPNLTRGWDRVAGDVNVRIVPGTHTSIVLPAGLPALAEAMRERKRGPSGA